MATRVESRKGKAWNARELDIIVELYLRMLDAEIAGEKYNKAATKREGLKTVARTPGSWEMKACNVSAALNDHGLPYVAGYKPLPGYQRAILESIARLRPEWATALEAVKS